MWEEPYLETCCRSALHRMHLAGPLGRPDGLKDGPCLARLAERGLARRRLDGRYELTEAGRARHAAEVLRAAVGA
jgi:DNA-binding transcriptional regulator PaaX